MPGLEDLVDEEKHEEKASDGTSIGAAFGEFLTLEEVAAFLKLPAKYIVNMARERKIPHKRFGRFLRFSQEELKQWLMNGDSEVKCLRIAGIRGSKKRKVEETPQEPKKPEKKQRRGRRKKDAE